MNLSKAYSFNFKQLWYPQLQMEVLLALHAYFAGPMSALSETSEPARVAYTNASKEFLLIAAAHLLSTSYDADLKRRERTVIVISNIYSICNF
jgi:hypothetical protein